MSLCTPEQAEALQVSQLSASGCGATAVVNVLIFLGLIRKEDVSTIDHSCCILRQRRNDAPLPQYLQSRYDAGCTGEELLESMHRIIEVNQLSCELEMKFVTGESIESLSMPLSQYLHDEITSGWVPVATMNLQLHGNDAWHHQVIYSADVHTRKIHMLNPFQSYTDEQLRDVVSTPSVLLVRLEDVLLRLDREISDDSIYDSPHWKCFAVRKQIADICAGHSTRPFVIIPAAYRGGFAMFRKKPNPTIIDERRI